MNRNLDEILGICRKQLEHDWESIPLYKLPEWAQGVEKSLREIQKHATTARHGEDGIRKGMGVGHVVALEAIRGVLPVYRASYPHDQRLEKAFADLEKFCTDKLSLRGLKAAWDMAETALNDAAADAEKCATESVNKFWAAADAAEAVCHACLPEPNMDALLKAAEEAIRWGQHGLSQKPAQLSVGRS